MHVSIRVRIAEGDHSRYRDDENFATGEVELVVPDSDFALHEVPALLVGLWSHVTHDVIRQVNEHRDSSSPRQVGVELDQAEQLERLDAEVPSLDDPVAVRPSA